MARIASQSKGGYYPTPVKEMELLCKRIRFQLREEEGAQPIINLIDPCCGQGEALKQIADSLKIGNPITYGVELEEGRCNTAATVLDHVIHDGYENLRTVPKHSLLWLNPPYDDGFSERLELTFLRALTGKNNVLEKHGLLIFCVPQHVLKPAAGVLSGRFRDIRVYRFTDENYPVFDQVVLIGRYGKDKNSRDYYKMLREVGDEGPEALPSLDEIDEDILVYSSLENIDLFRAGRLKPEELKRDFVESPLFKDLEHKLVPASSRAVMKNPLLPLKPTHTGIAIASGAVGGNMGSHIISGITKQITDVEDRTNEDGEKVGELITKHFRSVVRVFCSSGVHDLE